MPRVSRIVLNVADRHATLLAIIAAVAIGEFLPLEACAGLTTSLARENSASFAVWPDAPCSSGAPAAPASESTKTPIPHTRFAAWLASPALADTGGASPPVSGATGFAELPAAAIDGAAVYAPHKRAFRFLRETTPHWRRPLLRELLDPPKRG